MTENAAQQWELLYNQTPLCDVLRHYQGIRQSPFLLHYLTTVLDLCPRGSRSLETGVGAGYGAIWLSQRGVAAEGLDYAPGVVERAGQVNNILGGSARFRHGDLFDLYSPDAPRYRVIHHQGVLEHFTLPQIRAALAQQVALADYAVFSVPSVYYPFDGEFGDERLLPLEEWKLLLAPFDVADLRYYGDPQYGAREHILAVLRGQPVDDALLRLMRGHQAPYPEGISVIVHTRNEAHNIEACLQSVSGADQIIVCDMESQDDTVAIAERFTDQIVPHPHIQNFDQARNASAMRAKYRWILYVDADERVPPGLMAALRRLVAEQGDFFSGALIPFRHIFAGHWMQCLYPGYTAPRLLKNGKFVFNARLHSGAQVDGPIVRFPADNPDLSIEHFSFASMAHYLEKLNRYTDGEAQNMQRDGAAFHWHNAVRHFVKDFGAYYDQGHASMDGVHGFLYSFFSGFYRFEQHAKLYERRFRAGQLQPFETAVPANLREMLEFMISVADEKPVAQPEPIRVVPAPEEPNPRPLPGPLAPLAREGGPLASGQEGTAATPEPASAGLPSEERSFTARGSDPPVPTVGSPDSPLPAAGEGPWDSHQRTTEQGVRVSADGPDGPASRDSETGGEDAPGPSITQASPLPSEERAPAGEGSWDSRQRTTEQGVRVSPSAGEGPWDSRQRTTEQGVRVPDAVLSGPLWDPSGYGEEVRNFLFGLDDVGMAVAGHVVPWSNDRAELAEAEALRLEELSQRAVHPGFVQIVQNFPTAFVRHPEAGVAIGRTMFETDRLPQDWVAGCNRMDYVWVPTEFHRRTFVQSGVDAAKLAVIPGCLDPAPYLEPGSPCPVVEEARAAGLKYLFLTVFDWTRHKGWDVLLRAFAEAFEGREDVGLLLRVWSTMGHGAAGIEEQASSVPGVAGDPRIRFLHTRLSRAALLDLYKACDAFVLPSRGEGWGRPYMEAMACGKPAIGTNWSGNTAFMTAENSYLVDCTVEDVPEIGWREIPTYRGHRWAEPDIESLKAQMLRVVEERGEAARIGARAQEEIGATYNRTKVGRLMAEEIARVSGAESTRQEWATVHADGAAAHNGHSKPEAAPLSAQPHIQCETAAGLVIRDRRATSAGPQEPNPRPLPGPLAPLAREEGTLASGQEGTAATPEPALAGLPSEERSFTARGSDPSVPTVGSPDSPLPSEERAPAGEGQWDSHQRSAEQGVRVSAPAGEGQWDSRQRPAEQGVRVSAPVRLEGAFFNWHSLALVNREIATGLLRGGKVELSIVPTEPAQFAPRSEPRIAPLAERSFATLTGPAAVHVRHFYPPRFERPDEGKFVLMQPWEYGFLPTRWVEPIRDNVDEVWCYSRYVRDVYVASGIPAAKLQVVPLGVDAATFTPEAPPYVFTTETGAAALRGRHGRFVFLFVGSTQHRKGIDILLEAYRRAFTVYDDVCLVIKDTGTQTVYRYGNKKEEILALIADSGHAPIVYLDDDLPPALLAGLYTAADCLVQCYRGEGFCLPALEGMSCGLPVMATAGGPTDDFVDDAVGWPLPSERRQFGNGSVGDMDCVGPAWMFEVDVDTLARTMRRVSQQPEQVAEKGRVAAERVRTAWTWAHTVAAIEARITALAAVAPTPRTVVPRAVNDRSVDGKPAEAGSGGFTLRSTPAVNFSPVSGGRPEGPRRGSGGGGARKTSRANGKAANDSPPPFLGQGEGASGAASPEPWTLDPKPCLRPQPTISLCMIVRNEERVFGACLDTATPHFDEVIVVDTGSTDRTVEIAKAHGAKVFHFPWTESFSEARNVSLSHATGDWLFWMDADDTLPEACGRALRDLVRLAEDRTTGFLMQVQIPAAPGENGFTVVDHVKLFRNRPELRFEGRIHEQILDPIYRAGGNIERTNLYVVHSGYDYSPEGQKHKRARDLRLLDLDLAERPDHPFVLFNIGMTAYHMKDYEKAISALERCLAVSKPHESTVRKVYAMLEGCHLEQGDLMRARERLEQGLALYPQDPELLFRAGILYRELGDPAAAERAYVKLLRERETGHIDSLDVSMLTYKAHHNLALIYQDLGRLQEAYREWQAALADNPSFVPSLLGCAELLLHLRRFEDAEAIAARLDHLAPDAATTLRGRLEAARELQHV